MADNERDARWTSTDPTGPSPGTAPDFTPLDCAQRWTGRFSDDGGMITGQWETSPAGGEWQLDFHLAYRRSSGEM